MYASLAVKSKGGQKINYLHPWLIQFLWRNSFLPISALGVPWNICYSLLTSAGQINSYRLSFLYFTAPANSPNGLNGTNSSSTSVIVSWNPLETKNGTITNYMVYYRMDSVKDSTTNSVQLGSSTLQVNITGLSVYTNYNISVSASTKAGEGPKSGGIIVKTDEASKFTNCSQQEVLKMFLCSFTAKSEWSILGHITKVFAIQMNIDDNCRLKSEHFHLPLLFLHTGYFTKKLVLGDIPI